MWKTRNHKRSQRTCLLATYFVCSSDKGRAICGTSNETLMTKGFQKAIWRVPNALHKKASEQEESHSTLCNLYSAVKCTSLQLLWKSHWLYYKCNDISRTVTVFEATVVKLIFFFIKEILICMIKMSAQINACAGEWITEQKCHLPRLENRTNKQAARRSSELDPAPSGSRSIILRSCNRLQARAKARRLSPATAQMLGIFALVKLNHFGRENYSLIKTLSPLWFRG